MGTKHADDDGGSNRYDNGRKAYREPDEPHDDRPVIVRSFQFRDGDEQAAYERAVSEINPCAIYSAPRPAKDDSKAEQQREAGEQWISMQRLLDEIVTLATGLDVGAALKRTPHLRMSQREWERRQWEAKRAPAGYFRDPSGG